MRQHMSAMVAEMSKKRPRDHVILPLLKSTYSTQRDFITSDDRSDIQEILKEYPALRFPIAVSLFKVPIVSSYPYRLLLLLESNSYLTMKNQCFWPHQIDLLLLRLLHYNPRRMREGYSSHCVCICLSVTALAATYLVISPK